jgi:tRNA threonylcarbamoyladenosine biosynthesis protein TsaE
VNGWAGLPRRQTVTEAPGETEGVASRLGKELRPRDLVALEGPLGAGKTVFVRGLARGLGVEGSVVRSPTFVLHHVYGAPPRLHHLDLFRLGAGAVVTLLDLDTLLDTAPVVVEWAGLADLDAWRPLRLAMEILDERRRGIAAVRAETAPERLLAAWETALRP